MELGIRMGRLAGGCFKAWCPALPGCVVWGRFRDETVRKIRQAIRAYVAHIDQAMPRELARLAHVS